MNLEWICLECGNEFVTDENVYLHCPDCGSDFLSQTNLPDPDPEEVKE